MCVQEWLLQQLGPCMPLQEAQQKLDALQQQGLGQPAHLDLLSLDQMLEDAYHEHLQSCDTHSLFKECAPCVVRPPDLAGPCLNPGFLIFSYAMA